MKKLIITLAIILYASSAFALSPLEAKKKAMAARGKAAGGTCTLGVQSTTQASVQTIGAADATYYIGNYFNDASSRELCQVDITFYDEVGTVSGKNFYVKVWDLTDTTTLSTEKATSAAVADGAITPEEWVAFPLVSNFTTTGGVNYAITLHMDTTDGSNHFRAVYTDSSDFSEGNMARWDIDKTQETNQLDYDINMKIYWIQ